MPTTDLSSQLVQVRRVATNFSALLVGVVVPWLCSQGCDELLHLFDFGRGRRLPLDVQRALARILNRLLGLGRFVCGGGLEGGFVGGLESLGVLFEGVASRGVGGDAAGLVEVGEGAGR